MVLVLHKKNKVEKLKYKKLEVMQLNLKLVNTVDTKFYSRY